ncbi:YveK family protein [Romboutsia sp.]|uniref:YveK family protein n=1 Tax=Romboutsia sp. TaxID=1965302 RepID=UPI003F36826F
MEETIDLREYFEIIKKRAWVIILTTIIGATVSFGISKLTYVPIYEAKTTLIVNAETYSYEGRPYITGEQIMVSEKLAVLYGEIVNSRAVLQPIIRDLNLKTSYEALSGQISVTPVNETQILNLSVKDTDPERARDIANKLPSVFSEEVKRITKASGVEVIDSALLPEFSINSDSSTKMAISAVLGMMTGLFIIFLLEFLDNKIKTPQDIQKHLEIPVLGVIPKESLIK